MLIDAMPEYMVYSAVQNWFNTINIQHNTNTMGGMQHRGNMGFIRSGTCYLCVAKALFYSQNIN